MSANISSPQLRKKLDTLAVVLSDVTKELATLKALVVTNGLTVDDGGALITAGGLTVSAGDIDLTTGDLNVDAGNVDIVTGGLTVAGATTVDGGPLSYGADDSGGTGFRYVLVPNAV